ncbi:MAG: two component system response regulator FlrC [Elusimicrobia bacterium]|nr:MAG: two component system response regulator FlrC [Elusimicrobiota bacterium]KAF0156458.1 MAG: two component system response regulator FlrC [Elusimicrobiota bacterium]
MAKILIVDDEPDMRLAIKNVLRLRGHEVSEAQDGPSALAALEGEKPDLVLLDIRLPGMDGIELLERIRKMSRSLPVVMITGYGHIQSAVDVMKLGANEYLQKPFENSQLVDTVKRFTSGRKPAPAAAAGDIPPHDGGDAMPQGVAKPLFTPARLLALAAAAAALLLFFRWSDGRRNYAAAYESAGANVSSLVWRGGDLWVSDWLEQSLYRYAPRGGKLALAEKVALPGTHITGFAFGDDALYICDSWAGVVQERTLEKGFPVARNHDLPGKITSLFFDGKYLWTCDSEGVVSRRRTGEDLPVEAEFRLAHKPDQIYKDSGAFWSVVSSSGRLYRHRLDDKLSVEAVFTAGDPGADRPLSAFTWSKGRLWLAREGGKSIGEYGPGILKETD